MEIINDALSAARKYSAMEWGFLKVCLCCLGILLGITFFSFFSYYLIAVCVIFGFTWVYLVYRTIKYWKEIKEVK